MSLLEMILLNVEQIKQEHQDPNEVGETPSPPAGPSSEWSNTDVSGYPGIPGVTNQGNPTLVYFLESDASLCFKFCQKRANQGVKKFSTFYCIGCKSKGKNISIHVYDNKFATDPALLNHICLPKTTIKELVVTMANEVDSRIDDDQKNIKSPVAGTSRKRARKEDIETFYPGVPGVTTQGNPTMVFLLESDNSLCFKFCQKRANLGIKKLPLYYCVGCKSKGKNVSVNVAGDKFTADPCQLGHICEPKTTTKEIAAAVVNEHLASLERDKDAQRKKPKEYFDDLLEKCETEAKIPDHVRDAVVESVSKGGHRHRRQAYSRRLKKANKQTTEDTISTQNISLPTLAALFNEQSTDEATNEEISVKMEVEQNEESH